MGIDEFLGRIKNVKKTASGWMGLCPVLDHNDENSSLSVGEGNDGRILVKCFGGCSAEGIVNALGLKLKDLYPSRQKPQRSKRGEGGRIQHSPSDSPTLCSPL